jgi:hypothetical protein
MTAGEIDCRYDDGIIKHCKKHGGNLDDIAATTARRYVRNVADAMRDYGHEVIFLNVPAPHIAKLREFDNALSPNDEDMLVRVIRLFNEHLTLEAASQNLSVIDVYRLTADVSGRADGTHHIDSHHLKPCALAMAISGEIASTAA